MDVIFSTLHPANKNMKCQPGWNSACAEASVRLFQWLHYKKRKKRLSVFVTCVLCVKAKPSLSKFQAGTLSYFSYCCIPFTPVPHVVFSSPCKCCEWMNARHCNGLLSYTSADATKRKENTILLYYFSHTAFHPKRKTRTQAKLQDIGLNCVWPIGYRSSLVSLSQKVRKEKRWKTARNNMQTMTNSVLQEPWNNGTFKVPMNCYPHKF